MNSAGFPGLVDHFTTNVSDLQKMIDIKITLRDDSEFLEHVQVSVFYVIMMTSLDLGTRII